jgi:DNA-3-methyladenine glycosylase II
MDFDQQLQQACQHLSMVDPTVQLLIERYGKCTIAPHSDHYGALLSAIIGQQLSEKAGATIERRFLDLWNGQMPSPKKLSETDPEIIRGVGVSYGKISYMQDLALHILDGRLDMQHIISLDNEEIVTKLTAVKGIGDWTAHMFLIFSLGRLNVLPTKDLGIRKAMMLQYGLPHLPNHPEMHQIATENQWAPFQSVACWYLWRSLENQ